MAGMKNSDIGKTRMSGSDRRSQIVKVAMRLFAKKGFKGTTTREIAEKALISEAVIFRHFSRKQDLYTAIIDARCNDKQGESILYGKLKGVEGREVFSTVASYLISEHQKDSAFLRLLTYSALEGHDLSEIFIRTKGLEFIEFLEARIKALIKNGVFRKTDASLAARAFMGMVVHYSFSQEVYGLKRYYKRPNAKAVGAFVDIFFEGMRRR